MASNGPQCSRVLLPVTGQPPPERADAARNRRALLSAARTITVEEGVAAVSMDRVAVEAGVGVGTVYRRFSDRAGLLYALLDDSERQFQAGFLSGPPPLGPGAPPAQRIRAFLHACVDLLDVQGDLLAAAETHSPAGRYRSGAHWARRAHLIVLFTHADPDGDPMYLADALLAAVGASLVLHQRRELGFSSARIKAGLDQLITGVTSVPLSSASKRR